MQIVLTPSIVVNINRPAVVGGRKIRDFTMAGERGIGNKFHWLTSTRSNPRLCLSRGGRRRGGIKKVTARTTPLPNRRSKSFGHPHTFRKHDPTIASINLYTGKPRVACMTSYCCIQIVNLGGGGWL